MTRNGPFPSAQGPERDHFPASPRRPRPSSFRQ
jgi:hypothetical protein